MEDILGKPTYMARQFKAYQYKARRLNPKHSPYDKITEIRKMRKMKREDGNEMIALEQYFKSNVRESVHRGNNRKERLKWKVLSR